MQGFCCNSAHFWAPEKARVRQPLLILSPLLGDPRMKELRGSTTHLWAPKKARVR